eukprot:TRINITY_DN8616_c0_g1::TRINITY_DN8616_c0_g1_i1::g.311::m.311 TRINITY_DN8616_c0_g1::TRINITY_DN8616_c0_g1_i1::g.311  ORF type:complete len:592 (+),score=110.70,Ctr/PF04145.10/24,Ctr/PF04145.10/17,Otopetrin/PF03189.8/2.9,Otopetrin/PF03189.8/48 TRINITY_DN8616_c0_g1_i1:127-1776(+)
MAMDAQTSHTHTHQRTSRSQAETQTQIQSHSHSQSHSQKEQVPRTRPQSATVRSNTNPQTPSFTQTQTQTQSQSQSQTLVSSHFTLSVPCVTSPERSEPSLADSTGIPYVTSASDVIALLVDVTCNLLKSTQGQDVLEASAVKTIGALACHITTQTDVTCNENQRALAALLSHLLTVACGMSHHGSSHHTSAPVASYACSVLVETLKTAQAQVQTRAQAQPSPQTETQIQTETETETETRTATAASDTHPVNFMHAAAHSLVVMWRDLQSQPSPLSPQPALGTGSGVFRTLAAVLAVMDEKSVMCAPHEQCIEILRSGLTSHQPVSTRSVCISSCRSIIHTWALQPSLKPLATAYLSEIVGNVLDSVRVCDRTATDADVTVVQAEALKLALIFHKMCVENDSERVLPSLQLTLALICFLLSCQVMASTPTPTAPTTPTTIPTTTPASTPCYYSTISVQSAARVAALHMARTDPLNFKTMMLQYRAGDRAVLEEGVRQAMAMQAGGVSSSAAASASSNPQHSGSSLSAAAGRSVQASIQLKTSFDNFKKP